MLPLNQQGANSANLDMSRDNVLFSQFTQPPSNTIAPPTFNHQFTLSDQSWNSYQNDRSRQPSYYSQLSSYSTSTQFQENPVIASQYPVPQCYGQPQRLSNLGNRHKAKITLVPNSSGGFKAIVKRKRKRTMFTTEQVEVLESVFKRKPYVTREDRQVLVNQLQLTDTSVKVWFQNRRLRGKREEMEAAEEALYEDAYMTVQECEPSLYRPDYSSRLDIIERKLLQKVNESGYILLDEESIEDLVSLINCALSPDVNFHSEMETSHDDTGVINISETAYDTCNSTDSGNATSSEVECIDDSESIHDSVSIYEPISPAESNGTDENIPAWEPCNTEQSNSSLQKLFDRHFC